MTGEATCKLPAYLRVPAEELGRSSGVRIRIAGDAAALARDMATAMAAEIREAAQSGRPATLIVPVGPVDQFPALADMINRQRLDCRGVAMINMDEYLTDRDEWLPADHPLSFGSYMARSFYERIDPSLAPAPENRIFPDPRDPAAIQRLIDRRGGVDACFGGIGINGHIAFNEPPEPGEIADPDEFAARPTRVLALSRETRTINAVTVGGEIGLVPRRAITVGMKECLAARWLRFYCNRPWQAAVVRRVLHGPVTAACPASLLRTHPDAVMTLTDGVAAPPQIMLR